MAAGAINVLDARQAVRGFTREITAWGEATDRSTVTAPVAPV